MPGGAGKRKRGAGEAALSDARTAKLPRIMSGENACQAWAAHLLSLSAWSGSTALPGNTGVVAVFGAYNAGKSALVNSLLGEDLLQTAPVEQTHEPWAVVAEDQELDESLQLALPTLVRVESQHALDNLIMIDTPGYGGVEGGDVIDKILPLCQASILCISSQTPVTVQDVDTARRLSEGGRRVLVVLTKSDLARNDAELQSVTASVKSRLASSLHEAPQVWKVAALPTHAEDEHFQISDLISDIRSLGRHHRLQHALMLTSQIRLDAATNSALARLKNTNDTLATQLDQLRKADAEIDRFADGVQAEVGVCLQRVGRQAHELQDTSLDSELPFSTPLVSFRRQIVHMTELLEHALDTLLSDSTLQQCHAEVSRFREGCVEILRECEDAMDSVASVSDDAASTSEAVSRDSSSFISRGMVSAATSVAAGVLMGPAAAFAAAAVGVLGSLTGRRRSECPPSAKPGSEIVMRRLLGQPAFYLELVQDNVDRLRSALRQPILNLVIDASEQQRTADQQVAALQRCREEYLPCIKEAVISLRDSMKHEEEIVEDSSQMSSSSDISLEPGASLDTPVRQQLHCDRKDAVNLLEKLGEGDAEGCR